MKNGPFSCRLVNIQGNSFIPDMSSSVTSLCVQTGEEQMQSMTLNNEERLFVPINGQIINKKKLALILEECVQIRREAAWEDWRIFDSILFCK